MKNKIPKYLNSIINENPKICSGRKNFAEHQYRIEKNIKLIKEYLKKQKKAQH